MSQTLLKPGKQVRASAANRFSTWAFCATLACGLGSSGTADARTLYVNAGDATPVAAAVRSGDLALLRRLEQGTTDPEVKSIITASIARMIGRYDDSIRVAKGCYEQATSAGQTSIALVCGRVWASNYYLRGDLNTWASVLGNVWKTLKPDLAKAMKTDDISLYELDFASQVPALHYTETSVHAPTHGSITVHPASHKDSEYLGDALTVDASVGDKPVTMTVDTGAAFSTLSDADAMRLGIKPTDVTVRVRTTPEAESSQNEGVMKLAVVPAIRIGEAQVTGAIVLIGGANQSVMGLNIISRLPSPLLISGSAIAFGHPKMQCDRPTITATDLSGTIGTAFGIAPDIDGSTAFAALDLGNNAYVEGYANAVKHATSATALPMVSTRVNEKVPASYYTGRVSLSAGPSGQKINAPLLVLTSTKPAFDWTVGSGVLKDFSIYLDFENHAACLTRRG